LPSMYERPPDRLARGPALEKSWPAILGRG